MTRALYLSFSGYSDHNGISKKKLSQIKGLKECGCSVVNCYYTVNPDNGDRLWMVDDKLLINLGSGFQAKIRKRIDYRIIRDYIKDEQIQFVYMRSEHNANPFLIRLISNLSDIGVKAVMEIPTFPYDHEYTHFRNKCSLLIDKIFRKRLAKKLHAIVTFTNQPEIFGQRSIQISNGIDFSSLRIKNNKTKKGELHLIGVAEIHFWHGFDRIVAGLRDYFRYGSNECNVFFHIVGEFSGVRERDTIIPMIKDNRLEKYVIFHGALFGEGLDQVFDLADIGVGSLARHRSCVTHIKTLKNREYAARGIPFIYSEIDEDFESMPYIMKVSSDDSPINIENILRFYEEIEVTPTQIRDSVQQLSWKNQMQKVLDAI